jgi:hypothetical protein
MNYEMAFAISGDEYVKIDNYSVTFSKLGNPGQVAIYGGYLICAGWGLRYLGAVLENNYEVDWPLPVLNHTYVVVPPWRNDWLDMSGPLGFQGGYANAWLHRMSDTPWQLNASHVAVFRGNWNSDWGQGGSPQ